MAILGSLTEFPLPEVLLMIGSRTGRLRLYDIPEFGVVEVDLAEGQTHAVRLGGTPLTDTAEMVRALGVILEANQGMFEFRAQPVTLGSHGKSLQNSQLVMLLVLEVDKKAALERALQTEEQFYVLEDQEPQIAINLDLRLFYQHSWQLLQRGVWVDELADYLGLKRDIARLNMSYLRQLGFVKLLDKAEVEAHQAKMRHEEVSEITHEFKRAVEISDKMRRATQRLNFPRIKGQ